MKNFSELAGRVATVKIEEVLPSECGWIVLQVLSKSAGQSDVLDEFPVPANFDTIEEFKATLKSGYDSRIGFNVVAPSSSTFLSSEDDLFEAKLQFLGVEPIKTPVPEVPFTAFTDCYLIDEADGWRVRLPDGSAPGISVPGGRIATAADIKRVLGDHSSAQTSRSLGLPHNRPSF